MSVKTCELCGKSFSIRGLGTHVWRMHGNGKNHDPNIGYKSANRTAWNKNLTKEQDDRVKKQGETYSKNLKNGKVSPSFLGKSHTLSSKEKISSKLSVNNKGGRCKWFDFNKSTGEIMRVQGTWELRFANILEKIDPDWIKIGNNTKDHSFIWKDDDNMHNYTPDFYSPKFNKYYEVKGYWWGNDKIKMEKVLLQNSINLEMIFKKDLEKYEKLFN